MNFLEKMQFSGEICNIFEKYKEMTRHVGILERKYSLGVVKQICEDFKEILGDAPYNPNKVLMSSDYEIIISPTYQFTAYTIAVCYDNIYETNINTGGFDKMNIINKDSCVWNVEDEIPCSTFFIPQFIEVMYMLDTLGKDIVDITVKKEHPLRLRSKDISVVINHIEE